MYDALCETLGRPREDHYAAAPATAGMPHCAGHVPSGGVGEALAQALDLEALSARYREALGAGKEASLGDF